MSIIGDFGRKFVLLSAENVVLSWRLVVPFGSHLEPFTYSRVGGTHLVSVGSTWWVTPAGWWVALGGAHLVFDHSLPLGICVHGVRVVQPSVLTTVDLSNRKCS